MCFHVVGNSSNRVSVSAFDLQAKSVSLEQRVNELSGKILHCHSRESPGVR